MTRFLLGVCLVAWSAYGAAPELSDILKGVEQRYNRARTLEVRFQQTFQVPRRGKRTEAGELYLRKPGRMRWQYTEPSGKLFVSDGKNVYLYLPDEHRVERSKMKESEDMRAPLAFLLGKLDFNRDFKRFVVRRQGEDTWISADPRSDRVPYDHVEFLVTPQYEIRQLQVVGQQNDVMEFRFEQEKLNLPLAEKLFQFTPPAGAEVVEGSQ